MRGILTVIAAMGLMSGNIVWAKLPFHAPKKIKVTEWKAELKWSEDAAGKILNAQASFDNREKLLKGKIKKENAALNNLLEQKDSPKAEVDAIVKTLADLGREKLESDVAFVLDVKKALNADQQMKLMEKMTPAKKSRAGKMSKEDKDDDQ